MSRLFLLTLIFFQSLIANSQEWSLEDLKTYTSFDDFENDILKAEEDGQIYIINFWATWCGPCVKELPYFEKLNDLYKDNNVKVVLVSLDFEKQIEKRLIPFLNKNAIQSDVVLLLDPKESEWIDRVDPNWSGAIPITLIKKGNDINFYEQVFHSVTELTAIIEPHLKN